VFYWRALVGLLHKFGYSVSLLAFCFGYEQIHRQMLLREVLCAIQQLLSLTVLCMCLAVWCLYSLDWGARCWWRSWLRNCATRRKVAGSILDGVIGIFH